MNKSTYNALLVGAQPHTILPSRKMPEKDRYTQFRGNTTAILPASGVRAHTAKVYAAGYQAN
jgi:hypothetical protein